MKRRDFLALLGGAAVAWPSVALAQQASKAKRLSIFSPSEPVALIQENSDNRYYRALFDELQNTAGPAALVAEVVRNNPDVVYVVGPGALEFKVQTAIIPIVGLTGDPLALGLVQSLAHPGGNVTGVSVDTGPSIHGSGSNCCAHRNQASAPTHPNERVRPFADLPRPRTARPVSPPQCL
jgi:putative tryptophan/tyrosine transport system substrate-binding protein